MSGGRKESEGGSRYNFECEETVAEATLRRRTGERTESHHSTVLCGTFKLQAEQHARPKTSHITEMIP